MQAIITKDIAPTNPKPSRIKASCERGSVTMSYHSAIGNPHIEAAEMLVTRFAAEDAKTHPGQMKRNNPWLAPRACGELPNGDYAHVFIS
jgi:hypothetical protein